MSLKRTALYDVHRRLGARIVSFAGYEMPVQYTGIVDEHRRVREHVGLFDVSHMGEVEIAGKDALAFVQRVTINDAGKLFDGRVQYSAMCYEDGGIVDDLLVYHRGDHFLMVVNSANLEKDLEWMRRHATGDVRIRNTTDETCLIAVQGPHSLSTLRKLTDVEVSDLPYYHFLQTPIAGVETMVSRTGYTGELGYELYLPAVPPQAEAVWDALTEAGREFGIGPAGLGARDTLRLEMGYPLYGNDIDQTTNPIEAGLGWITKFEKGDFVGREALLAAKKEGVKRRLVGFMLKEKAVPRQHYGLHADGDRIGTVTSGTFSPTLENGIGMGYVDNRCAEPGTEIALDVRNRKFGATVVSLPFVKQ
jgi:aminomethyltransferase